MYTMQNVKNAIELIELVHMAVVCSPWMSSSGCQSSFRLPVHGSSGRLVGLILLVLLDADIKKKDAVFQLPFVTFYRLIDSYMSKLELKGFTIHKRCVICLDN